MVAIARAVPLMFVLSVLVAVGSSPSTAPPDVKLVAPESVGFSSAGLKAFEQTMRALVDEGQLAGVTTLVARHGKVVHVRRLRLSGSRDQEAGRQGHDLPHRVDDQADRRRGDDDALGSRASGRSTTRSRSTSRSSPASRSRRRTATCRRPSDDDAAADEPHRRLRRQRRLRQGQHRRPRQAAAGDDRQARRSCRCRPSRAPTGATDPASTSRATSSRSCRASRSTCSCERGSSSRSG